MLCQCKESVIQKNETKYEWNRLCKRGCRAGCLHAIVFWSKFLQSMLVSLLSHTRDSILLHFTWGTAGHVFDHLASPATTAPSNSTFFLAFGFSPVFLGLFHGWLLDLFIFLLSFCLASYELAFILYLSLLIMPWIRLFNGYWLHRISTKYAFNQMVKN